MARYAQGYKGPMTTAGPARPVNKAAPVSGPQPFLDAVSPRRPPVNPTPVVGGQVRPRPTGPMTPVLGGGMAPASVAPMSLMGAKKPAAKVIKNLAIRGANVPTGTRTLMKKGGSVSSASKRADGVVAKGKTRGRMV